MENPTRLIHLHRHPTYVEGCISCKLLTVSISAAATPTRSQKTINTLSAERNFAKDEPAYRRLRKDGIQPNSVDGSAELEARS